MASNVGKKFEEDIKKSIPDYCLTIRIPDPPQSFTKRSDTRFSVKNPFDFNIGLYSISASFKALAKP